jgi:hypothetical protein
MPGAPPEASVPIEDVPKAMRFRIDDASRTHPQIRIDLGARGGGGCIVSMLGHPRSTTTGASIIADDGWMVDRRS